MEHLVPLIESYSGEDTTRYVSRGWNRSIGESNRAIIDGARRKYPTKGGSIHEILREALKANDMELARKFLTEYIGYLPIYWIRLLMFIQSNEMAELIMDHSTEEDIVEPLKRMFLGFSLKASDMKYIKPADIENTFITLNLVNKVSLLDYIDLDDIVVTDEDDEETPIATALHVSFTGSREKDLILPMRKNTLLWLMKKAPFAWDEMLEKDDVNAFRDDFKGLMLKMREIQFNPEYALDNTEPDMTSFKASLLDAYQIYLYLKPYGFEIFYNTYGRILDDRIKDGKALKDDEDINRKYKDDTIRPFMFRYNILAHGVSREETIILLARAIRDGDDEILDRWLNRDNMLAVIAKYGTVTDLFQILIFKGINPLWFQYFEDSSISKPSDLPPDLWSKYLANLFMYGSLIDTNDSYGIKYIIKRIFKLYRKEITQERMAKMIQMMKQNNRNDMIKWITSGSDRPIITSL